jgi:hypothetical protein
MSTEDPVKAAELRLKELEIELKQKELRGRARFDINRAAVFVTIVGGVAALIFQLLGVYIANTEKENAAIRATSDFDFKGVELFLKEKDQLITCDVDESLRNFQLFQRLFSTKITSAFQDIAASRTSKCATESGNKAADEALRRNEKPEQVAEAADRARYATIAQQSSLLAATKESDQSRLRVFIHINAEADRAAASMLQADLIRNGYAAPGIQMVSSAPSGLELRYYYKMQADQAGKLAALVAQILGTEPKGIKIAGPLETTFKSLPQQTMEFWFPRRS